MRSLRWMGLEWDEGPDIGGPNAPYRQTERREIYLQEAHRLIDQGDAYICFCTPERLEKVRQEQIKQKQNARYDGACRNLDPDEARRRVANGERHVIRFKMPAEGVTTGIDIMRGPVSVENRNLDDSIIVKSDGLAVYHLAAMVDDHLMDITHVMRGTEWLSTFPLHIRIIRALGYEEPLWVHLSLFLKPSGKGKMSKRDNADLSKDGHSIFLGDLDQLGYLPEAVVNWMVLMGWSLDDHTEFFSMQDLVENFSLERLNASPAAVNFSKLDHFNGLHIRNLSTADLAGRIKPFFETAGYEVPDDLVQKIAPVVQERIVTLDDAVEMAGFFFEENVSPNLQDLVGKNMTVEQSADAARQVLKILEPLPEISVETAEEPLRILAETLELKPGQLFGILRAAVTGKTISPPLFESMGIIGKEKVLSRIRAAIDLLEQA